MGLPCDCHGIAMGLPWDCHVIAMGLQWDCNGLNLGWITMRSNSGGITNEFMRMKIPS